MKEPLRSRALADWNRIVEEYDAPKNGIQSISEAVARVWDYAHFETFWNGVRKFYNDLPRPNRGDAAEGWDMAKECAPGGEEKQPEPPAPKAKPIIIRKGLNSDTDLPAIPDGYVDAPNWIPGIVGGLIDPKPIARAMTIEMQHEKRIEALEARVKELEGDVTYWKDLCANLHKAWDRSRKMQE